MNELTIGNSFLGYSSTIAGKKSLLEYYNVLYNADIYEISCSIMFSPNHLLTFFNDDKSTNIDSFQKKFYDHLFIQIPECNITTFKTIHQTSTYKLKLGNLNLLYNSQTNHLDITSDIFGYESFYYCVQKDTIFYSDRLDWLLRFCNNFIEINELALLETIYFNIIIPPKTFFKKFLRLGSNQTLTIKCHDSLNIKLVNNSYPFIGETKKEYCTPEIKAKLNDFSPNAAISSFASSTRIENLFDVKNKLMTYNLNIYNPIKPLPQPIAPHFRKQITVNIYNWFNHLPITSLRNTEPCYSIIENNYSLLLETMDGHNKLLCDAGIIYFMKAINSQKDSIQHISYKSLCDSSLFEILKPNHFTQQYLAHNYSELITFLKGIAFQLGLTSLLPLTLYYLLLLLPDQVRRIRQITKHTKNKILTPFEDPNFMFSNLLLLNEMHERGFELLSSLDKMQSDLTKALKSFNCVYETEHSIYNMFDALQRYYSLYKGDALIKKMFRLSPLCFNKLLRLSTKDSDHAISSFLIKLLTAEYLTITEQFCKQK
jgi:hypothetical protein